MRVTLGETLVTPRFTCSPALWERETAFAFALPLSFPALPPACMEEKHLDGKLAWKMEQEGVCARAQIKFGIHLKIPQHISAGQRTNTYCEWSMSHVIRLNITNFPPTEDSIGSRPNYVHGMWKNAIINVHKSPKTFKNKK